MSIATEVKVADLERRIGLLELQVRLLRDALDKPAKPLNDKESKTLTLNKRAS